MDVSLAELPAPIDDAGAACVRYIRSIIKDARFSREIITWLTEERRERNRKRVNQSRNAITYEVGDMVMARV